MLFASSQSEYRDMFWLIDPDSFPFHNNLVEAFVTHPLNGCTWAMAESIETGELEATESFVTLPPAVVTQHTLSQRKFVLLTTHGSYIITKLRPVDQLRHLLNESHSAQSESVEAFFYLHGSTQACAMCLILATGPNREVAHLAMEAYFKYGGEPHFIFPTAVGSSSLPMNGNNYQTSFQTSGSAFARVPVSQMSGISGNSLGGPVIGPEVQLSSKHEGLSLYLARLLRPLWNVNMTNQIMECGNNSIKVT
jgi:nuclear pore complex protein Nup155